MSYCNCNNRAFRALNYTYSAGSSLVINTGSSLSTLYNGTCYSLYVCKALPVMNTVVPVYVQINGNNIPVLDVIGNTLYSDQLRECTKYDLVYGSTPSHFKTKHCGCYVSSAVACSTELTAPATSAGAAESITTE